MARTEETPVLSVRGLKQYFKSGVGKNKLVIKAVDDISFDIYKGEVFSLVGESGCGKTTTGRTIIKLYEPTDGEVFFMGKRVGSGFMGLKHSIKETKRIAKVKTAEVKAEMQDEINEALDKALGKKAIIEAQILKKHLIKKYRTTKKEYALTERDSLIPKLKKDFTSELEKINKKIEDAKAAYAKDQERAKEAQSQKSSDQVAKEKIEAQKIKDKFKQPLEDIEKEKQEAVNKFKAEIKLRKDQNESPDGELMKNIQMIFQDPVASLNPRMTVKEIIAEGLRIAGEKDNKVILKKVNHVLETVGLLPEHASRYPHEFSGGQRQRIGIARALIVSPELLIADEPISALDVSIQAQVINLLNDLREELGITIMFIAHDLSVVKYFSDRIAVMYYGKLVELADKRELFKNPLHPYTKSLLSAVPNPDPDSEKTRQRVAYDPSSHDYSIDHPKLHEIKKGHFIYANEAELKEHKKALK